MAGTNTAEKPRNKGQRKRVPQVDVPAHTLDEALRVPSAIANNYAHEATRPLDVALAMDLKPRSTRFRMLCGSAIAYGLTKGGSNAETIEVLPLAHRILAPTEEGDDLEARREAIMKPRVLNEFLKKYDGYSVPRDNIAKNVLAEMGVPPNSTERVLNLILDSARSVGMLREIKGSTYVNVRSSDAQVQSPDEEDDSYEEEELAESEEQVTPPPNSSSGSVPAPDGAISPNRRVFITHGQNKSFLETLKDLLSFGELEPVISEEGQSVSQPVPDKVMNHMRSCSASIIHVDAERKLIDPDGETHVVLNENVLIEIGASMALYGRRFILLVREGIRLPSNLQGLYEVRYSSDKLDGDATIRLLKAIRDIKNHPLPSDAS